MSPLAVRLTAPTLARRSKSGSGARPSTGDGEGDALRLRDAGTGGGGPLPDVRDGLVSSPGTTGGVAGRLPSSLLAVVDVDA